MSGILYLCATPIGNRGDITRRVLDTLAEADLIAAEDTRHSRGLLDYYGIHKPLTSYHEHNKYEKAEELAGMLLAGQNIALITDAGTPAISDPGEVLVALCHEKGIPVTSLPGPCALITALSLSGFPARRFAFEGFLPMDNAERREILREIARERRTVILYEAPHRLRRTLSELVQALGDKRSVCLCRELTKIHEEAVAMPLGEAAALYAEQEPRGEYVLILAPPDAEELAAIEAGERGDAARELPLKEAYEALLAQGLAPKEALRRLTKERGRSRRELYQELHLKDE